MTCAVFDIPRNATILDLGCGCGEDVRRLRDLGYRYVSGADWFDRLAAPIRFYYNGQDLDGWLSRAQLHHTAISPTGLFGWRAYGEWP